MNENIFKKLNIEGLRANFFKYSKKAYQMLPIIENPHILNIGSSTKIPTIELIFI